MNTKDIGNRSEACVLAALLKSGEVVLLPFGDNERYDIVVERKGAFSRVQVKTGRMKDGYIVFDTCSSYAHRGRGKKDYRGDADLFGVYCFETDKVYLVPVDHVGVTSGRLRMKDTKNNQGSGVRWAKDYELTVQG